MCVGFGLLAAPNPPRSRKSSFLETGRHADFSELVDQEKLFGVPSNIRILIQLKAA